MKVKSHNILSSERVVQKWLLERTLTPPLCPSSCDQTATFIVFFSIITKFFFLTRMLEPGSWSWPPEKRWKMFAFSSKEWVTEEKLCQAPDGQESNKRRYLSDSVFLSPRLKQRLNKNKNLLAGWDPSLLLPPRKVWTSWLTTTPTQILASVNCRMATWCVDVWFVLDFPPSLSGEFVTIAIFFLSSGKLRAITGQV